MCALRWDDNPSPDQMSNRPVPVSRVPRAGQLIVWTQGPFRVIWTHYHKKHTYPCQERDCPYCATVPAHKKGYAPARVWLPGGSAGPGRWVFVVQEITESIIELADRPDLIGKAIVISRLGKKPNGKLYYELAPAHRQPAANAELFPFDIVPHLERIWDLPGRHLHSPCEQVVSPPADPPPVKEPVQTPAPREEVLAFIEREKARLNGGLRNGDTLP